MAAMRWMLLALALAGCGGSDPGLDGTWVMVTNGCGLGATFDTQAGTYVINQICALQGGGFGQELEAGEATIDGSSLTFVPKRASCPAHDHTVETDTYSFSAGDLVIASPNGVLVFRRAPPPSSTPGGASVANGCWDGDAFTTHPLQNL